MKLVKDGVSVELTNEIQISAYLNSGYTIEKKTEKTEEKVQKQKGTKQNGNA